MARKRFTTEQIIGLSNSRGSFRFAKRFRSESFLGVLAAVLVDMSGGKHMWREDRSARHFPYRFRCRQSRVSNH